jgi:hypothetical protein
MRLRLLAAATAASLVALAFPAAAQASHAWSNYHWARTANPFTLKLDNNVTSAWTSYLNLASSDWTASSVLNTTVVSGSFGSKSSCSPITGHVEVCNAAYGSTGWLGIASISITTGNHISSAFVKVNDTYFNQAQYNTVAYRRLVMCQEVGHTFGLGHQDENQTNPNLGTCMDYTSNPAGPPSNEHPNAHDFNQLQTIYSHLDSFNTPTFAAAASPTRAGESSPAAWGTLVKGSSSHGPGVYVRDLGSGNYTVTYVSWV